MDAKPPPTDPPGLTAGPRRPVSRIGGLGDAGFVGVIVAPLTDAGVVSAGSPDPTDGVVMQRLVYDHREADENAIGGFEITTGGRGTTEGG